MVQYKKMNHHHDCRKKIYLICILQAWFSVCACMDWSFTFPESKTVLKHSSVTIPCRFTSPENNTDINIIWFSDNKQVFNNENPSAVIKEYKDRTFLVGNDTNNCSLRINDVTKEAYYYPGISAEINSDALNKKRVKVILTDWRFTFPEFIIALRGSCVEIPCSFPQKDGDTKSSLIWYRYHFARYRQILNGRNPADVESDYRGRTSLAGNGTNSCSLRINDVKHNERYYPGINKEINSFDLQNRKMVEVQLTDNILMQILKGSDYMEEGRPVNMSFSVEHTCASSPPSMTCSKAATVHHIDLSEGKWRVQSQIIFSPSYQDNNTRLECAAKFPHGKRFNNSTILNIKFSPKNTTIKRQGNNNLTEGDKVTLQCITHANPPATSYTWYKGSRNSAQKLNETTKDTITFNVSWENEIYYCSARNDVGANSSAPIHLSVKYRAKGVRIQRNGARQDTMELECDFSSSNPAPTRYAWYHDGFNIPNENSKMLKKEIVNETSFGNYSCAVHNEVGYSQSGNITITITDAKTSDSREEEMTLILGAVAGVILVILVVLFMYFFCRWKRMKKSTVIKPASSQNRTVLDQMPMNDHLYGNIEHEPVLYGNVQPEPLYHNHTTTPKVREPPNKENQKPHAANDTGVVYAQSQKKKTSEDVFYTTIQHIPQNPDRESLRNSDNGKTLYTPVNH